MKNQPGSGEGSTAPTSPVSASKVDDEFEVTDESDVEETILEEEKLEQKVRTYIGVMLLKTVFTLVFMHAN